MLRTTQVSMVILMVLFMISSSIAETKSITIKYGEGGKLRINNNSALAITEGSLDGYMEEQSIDSVTITVRVTENTYFFGPTGAWFISPLILIVKNRISDVTLHHESGELLEHTRNQKGNKIKYKINHFSCYYYEEW